MAVLTQLNEDQLAQWLPQYRIGELSEFQQISTGIENSNYFVNTTDTTDVHRWVVTILEQDYASRDLLVPLTNTLHKAGLPVPRILPNTNGETVVPLAGKPAILSTRLPGTHPVNPNLSQCAAIGRFLACFHRAGQNVRTQAKQFARDQAWLSAKAKQVMSYLPFDEQSLLKRSLQHLDSLLNRGDLTTLPIGVVHGDLFRDNTLFNDQGLSGVLDFHHAGEHFLLFDIAVVANDWCTDNEGNLDTERCVSMLTAYNNERALTTEELWFLPLFMIYSATAFWLSRLGAKYPPPGQPPAARKNPEEFRAIVERRCGQFFYLDQRLLQRSRKFAAAASV